MKIAVTGASGLIGSALVRHLQSDGHTVLRLVRRAPRASDEVRWDPSAGLVDLPALQGVEGVAHLAGAGVGDHRWTDSLQADHPRLPRRRHHDPGAGPRPGSIRSPPCSSAALPSGSTATPARPPSPRTGPRHRLPRRRRARLGGRGAAGPRRRHHGRPRPYGTRHVAHGRRLRPGC
nr:NAD-dependent epimerase/dehydratase family protein [Angustibacter aerolatus]